MKESMVVHLKDFGKIAIAAGSNVVAAGARAAVEPGAQQVVVEHGNEFLHNILTGCQIVVALVTIAYIALKVYRLWKNKKATS